MTIALLGLDLLVILVLLGRPLLAGRPVDWSKFPPSSEAKPAEVDDATVVQFPLRPFIRDGEPCRIRPYVAHMPWLEPGPEFDGDLQRRLVLSTAAAEALAANQKYRQRLEQRRTQPQLTLVAAS